MAKASTATSEEVPRTAQGQSSPDHTRELVRPDRHCAQDPAQGQGPQWRRRPPAAAHLGDVPQVPGRPGNRPWTEEASWTAAPTSPSSRLPTAGATGPPVRTASAATNCWPSSTRSKPAGPTASVGPGLFAYLRGLASRGQRVANAEVIANVFKGVQNRMVSGYLLRDVLNKINASTSAQRRDPHPLAPVRIDAARDARRGRRLRRVLHATPRGALHGAGHRPATGRNGAGPGLRHRRLPGGGLRSPGDPGEEPRPATQLQRSTLFGQEAKPLPYMLAQMNLLLHGLEAPRSPMATPGSAASTRSATASAWT
jgi:hypothetical protein